MLGGTEFGHVSFAGRRRNHQQALGAGEDGFVDAAAPGYDIGQGEFW